MSVDRALSHVQRQIWIGQQLHPDSPLYNMALAITIEGDLDPARFSEAFAYVVDSTDALRTVFRVVDEDVERVVLDSLAFDFEIRDCGTGDSATTVVRRYIDTAVQQTMDISRRCFDTALLMCGPARHVWFLNQHHLICDASAFTILFERVVDRYEQLERGDASDHCEPEKSYQLLIDHEASHAGIEAAERATVYWDDKLAAPFPRPVLFGRKTSTPSTAATRVERPLGAERTEALRRLLQRVDVRSLTPSLAMFNVLAAVASAWLSRVGNQDRVGFGFFAHNRATRELHDVVGAFNELLPMMVQVEADDSFVSLVDRSRLAALESLRNAQSGSSHTQVLRDLNVILNLITTARASFGDRVVNTEWLANGHIDSSHDIRIQFHDFDGSGEFVAIFDCKDALFDETQRAYLADQFFQLLDTCLDDPLSLVSQCELVGAKEHEALAVLASEPDTDLVGDWVPVIRQIEQQVRQYPDRVACSDQLRSLTFAEIDASANALAHKLKQLQAPSSGQGDAVIAICLGRTVEFVIAVLAAHKSATAYLPIDPDYPHARCSALIESSGAVAMVVDETTREQSLKLAVPLVEVDLEDRIATPPAVELYETDLAYLIGTSGSVGAPKIIQVEQRNLRALIDGLTDQVYNGSSHATNTQLNVALVAPFAFDPSIQQLFAALALGHSLHIVANEARLDGAKLADFLRSKSIDVCDGTPAHLRLLLEASSGELSVGVDHFLIGGDVLPKPLARRFLEACAEPAPALTNLYGPAECCVDSTSWSVRIGNLDDFATVPIGRPLPGVRAYVVDDAGRLAPFGVVGELCVAGATVGRGYLADDDLTTAKFETDPFGSSDRRYRTGDLARVSSDGVIEFVERKDLLVKVQGQRIELSEVEAALKAAHVKRRVLPLRVEEPVRCSRCLLSEQHPGVALAAGICSVCRAFDAASASVSAYFGEVSDFEALLRRTQGAGSDVPAYDCMLLYSGGKDSSYVLYRLVELGLKVLAFTFDNGHISDAAFANIERQTTRLGVDSIVMDTAHMGEIFLQSLNDESTVCDGCFRALTTISTRVAIDHGIATVVTGLSRGQIFDTKLEGLIAQGVTDPLEIESKLALFRSGYHSRRDHTNELLDVALDVDALQAMSFVDWFRYDAATTPEVRALLEAKDEYWAQPDDTGFCSSNCRMNDVGIAVFSADKGYHNYEKPLSWDIRLGLVDRSAAIAEVQPPGNTDFVNGVLDDIGYLVRKVTDAAVTVVEDDSGARQLHAFYVADQALTVEALRSSLAQTLPRYMIPSRFFPVDRIPLTDNGKVDRAALRSNTTRPQLDVAFAPSTNRIEAKLVEVWKQVLDVDDVGIHDGFFAIGGDSIKALDVVIAAARAGLQLTPLDVFSAHTIAELATVTQPIDDNGARCADTDRDGPRPSRLSDAAPLLSAAEQSLLFEQRLRPDDAMFNIAQVFDVAGSIDVVRFEAALHAVVQRHEPLQWSYGEPRIRLRPEQAVALQVEPARVAGAEVEGVFAQAQGERFDLEHGPLFRCVVQPLTTGTTLVSFNLHHVCCDHLSFEVLWSSIADEYAGVSTPPVSVSYSDLVRWQSGDRESDRAFWQTQDFAAQFQPPPSLAGVVEPDGYLESSTSVSSDMVRNAPSSLFATAIAAAATASRPFFSSDDVEIGLVASTRNHETAQPLVGYLLNVVPMQLTVSQHSTFEQLVSEAASKSAGALVHRAYPFSQIVADARRAARQPPSGQILVSLSDEGDLAFDGARVGRKVRFNGFAVADLAFFLQLYEGEVTVGLEYSATVGRAAAEMALHLFESAIESLVAEPSVAITSQRHVATSTSLLIGSALPTGPLVLDRVIKNAAAHPNTPAVEVDGEALRWGSLFERACVVADHLRSVGVEQGDRVLSRQQRSVHVPVVLVATMLAGASYVPLAADTPIEKARERAQSVGATVEITTSGFAPLVKTSLAIDDAGFAGRAWSDWAHRPAPDELPTGSDEAYVIFTSGSTGQPNAVAIRHDQIAASTRARAEVYPSGPSRFAVLSGLGFDSSLVGLVWTLFEGGTIVFPAERQANDVDAVADLLAAGSLSHALCVPTLYGLLLRRRGEVAGWPAHMIVAGETCTPSLVAQHFATTPASRLTNEYGPTEATIWVTAHHCQPEWSTVPIGAPIAGAWVAIIDYAGRLLPEGVVGELVIGGAYVSAGYVNHKVHDRFGAVTDFVHLSGHAGVKELVENGQPMSLVRSGDRAVVVAGEVHYVGRLDEQLNIGGVRVEPGEIEASIASVERVGAVAVVATDVRSLDEMIASTSGDDLSHALLQSATASNPQAELRSLLARHGQSDVRLVAHLAAPDDVDLRAIRSHVRESLDPRHQPSVYVVHADLPRTTNGKVDRVALARLTPPAVSSRGGDHRGPQTMREEQMHSLFCEVLLCPSVEPDESFFALGGDSLRAIQLLDLAEERFDIHLPASAVHLSPTYRELAERIEQREEDS